MSKNESSDAAQDKSEQPSNRDASIIDAEIIESTPEAAAVKEPVGSGGRTALILAVLALCGVIVVLGLGYQQLRTVQERLVQLDQLVATESQQQAALKSSLADTEAAFARQNQQLDAQRKLLEAQDQKLAAERERLNQQTTEMEQTLESVYRRVGRSSNAWMAAEAEYLMRVANHRLRLEQDVTTALKALEAADSRLRDTGDPGWIAVRKLLAEEVASLQAVGQLDRSGLSSKLSSLVKQVKGLKMVGLQYTPAKPEARETKSEPQERSVGTLLKDGWSGFKSLMVIRHRDKPVAAMLPPEQQFFVYQNLELQLEASRMALLRGDKLLYDSSLQRVERWLGDFFDPEATATQAIVQAVGSLRAVDISPELPDISRSLMALRERLQATEGEGSSQ